MLIEISHKNGYASFKMKLIKSVSDYVYSVTLYVTILTWQYVKPEHMYVLTSKKCMCIKYK